MAAEGGGGGEVRLVLGSQSKWRGILVREMLATAAAGSPLARAQLRQLAADIDEKAIRHADPREMVARIARAKAEALVPRLERDELLLCSDEVVVCAGVVREKPESADECRAFLRSYATHRAEAFTSVCVYDARTGRWFEDVDYAWVQFAAIPEWKEDALLAQGDVMHAAGGFVIEELGDFTREVHGEVETIQGLPRAMTLELLGRAIGSRR